MWNFWWDMRCVMLNQTSLNSASKGSSSTCSSRRCSNSCHLSTWAKKLVINTTRNSRQGLSYKTQSIGFKDLENLKFHRLGLSNLRKVLGTYRKKKIKFSFSFCKEVSRSPMPSFWTFCLIRCNRSQHEPLKSWILRSQQSQKTCQIVWTWLYFGNLIRLEGSQVWLS